jgi:hypothetical protein
MASTASPKQTDLIRRLFSGITTAVEALPEGDPTVAAIEAALASHQSSLVKVLSEDELSSRDASKLIDALFRAERQLPPTEVRWVNERDRWLLRGAVSVLVPGATVTTTTRNGTKPATVGEVVRVEGAVAFATVAPRVEVEVPEGVHVNAKGELVTVKKTRSSGQTVAYIDGRYEGKRGLAGLSATTLATPEQVAAANPAAALVARVNPESSEVRLVLPTVGDGAVNLVAFWVITVDGCVYQTIGGAGDVPISRTASEAVITRAAELSDEELRAAVTAYGVELGTCGSCGRSLTNDDSRAAGIGPVCVTKGVFSL